MNAFRLVEHPDRMQPFTVWRGSEVWHFDASREDAEAYIMRRLAQELVRRAA